jgi:hypothetical protein
VLANEEREIVVLDSAVDPDATVLSPVDRGYTARYDHPRQSMQELLYGKWREYSPWTAPASAPCVCRRPV